MSANRIWRPVLAIASVFAAIAAAVVAFQPLTMDELAELLCVRQPTLADLLRRVTGSAGAVPLGFLLRRFSAAVAGYSNWAVRLPSALFAVASVAAVGALAKRSGAKTPWIAAALFAAFPVTLRYAVEARSYSQALCFSVVLTLLFLALLERPRATPAVWYGVALTLALYTQPFAALVSAGHLVWAAGYRKWKPAAYAGVAVAAAGAVFLPWLLWARAGWESEMTARAFQFSFSAKTPLMLFRELTGAGYAGSALVIALCILRRNSLRDEPRDVRTLLMTTIAATFACGLFADAAAGYFIASRQFLWTLPAFAVLAAPELGKSGRVSQVLAAILVVLCLYASARRIVGTREDWPAAARAVAAEVGRGACLQVAPPNALALYAYYEPQLKDDSPNCRSVVAAIPSQTQEQDRRALYRRLDAEGYSIRRSGSAGGTSILVWEK